MKKEKFGLKPEVIASIQGVFARYPQVIKVIIYGSRAKGNYKQGSDIDLTMIGAENFKLDLNTQFEIEEALDELMLPYLFDLSIHDRIGNENLLAHIGRVGQIFYKRQ